MKIAFVITGLGVGGAERVVVDIADSLAELGHTVRIYYLTGDAILKPEHPSIAIFGLGLGSIFTLAPCIFRLIFQLRSFNPDIVHTHLFHANILTRLIRKFSGNFRLISTAHIKFESWFRMLAYRFTDSLADITTNVCDEAVNSFIERKASRPDRIRAIHNGISTQVYRYIDSARIKLRTEFGLLPGQLLILAVGRLHEQKDYPNLLLAVSRLKVDRLKYKIVIAGVGNLDDELKKLSLELGISDRVQFVGLRRDVPDLMSAADVFVLSSEMEGFPMVVGEAMSSECLVVGTDCGGVREFLGDTGLLVSPKNPDELARMLDLALLMSEEMREAYGKSARARIKQYYSLDVAINKWISVYCTK